MRGPPRRRTSAATVTLELTTRDPGRWGREGHPTRPQRPAHTSTVVGSGSAGTSGVRRATRNASVSTTAPTKTMPEATAAAVCIAWTKVLFATCTRSGRPIVPAACRVASADDPGGFAEVVGKAGQRRCDPMLVRRRHDRAEDGDTENAADLTQRIADGRAGADAVHRQSRHHGRRGGRDGHTDRQAGQSTDDTDPDQRGVHVVREVEREAQCQREYSRARHWCHPEAGGQAGAER